MNDHPARETAEPKGASARIVREILRTPAFMEIIKINVFDQDPKAAADLVRTVMNEDPNLSLSLMAQSPRAFNALVEAVIEIGHQAGRFPPELLSQFFDQATSGIDTGRLAEIPRAWAPVIENMLAKNPNFLADAVDKIDYRKSWRALWLVFRVAVRGFWALLKNTALGMAGKNRDKS